MQKDAGRRESWALLALGAVILITVGWWLAALWPLPPSTPEWVVRARAACFGSTQTGLPNSGGWILLVGTPLTMVAALGIMAGDELRGGFRALRASRPGKASILGTATILAILMGAAGARVSNAYGFGDARADGAAALSVTGDLVRTSRDAPPLHLIDQNGSAIDLASLRGRPVIVTFAYAKCETVCPLIVHEASRALEATRELGTVLLVVTLDPWRDTPAGLPRIARGWGFGDDAHVLSGDVAEVEAVLDDWRIERGRDRRTGEISHPAISFVLDREGRVAFTLAGGARLEEAIRRLDRGPGDSRVDSSGDRQT